MSFQVETHSAVTRRRGPNSCPACWSGLVPGGYKDLENPSRGREDANFNPGYGLAVPVDTKHSPAPGVRHPHTSR